MAEHGRVDRRRQPRWTTRDVMECRIEMRSRVRVVDISATGVLLRVEGALPPGTRGRLRCAIGSSFTPDLEVERVAVAGPAPGLVVGARFTGIEDASRRSLEAFLKKANV